MSRLTDKQRRAVESVGTNVLVSAGAGCGKTHVLVERYVEILKRNPQLSASALVAVTYTRKAAKEMRNRLKARMDGLLRACSDRKDQARWSALRQEVDSARIGTIHSLCESVLKTFPAEAGVDPRFAVLDDLESAELLEASINAALLDLCQRRGEDLELLERYPLETIRAWVKKLVQSRGQFEEACQALPGLADDELSAHVETLLLRLMRIELTAIFSHSRWRISLESLAAASLNPKNNLEAIRQQVVELAKESEKGNLTPASLPGRVTLLRQIASLINLRVGGRDEQSQAAKSALKSLRQLIGEHLDHLPERVGAADLYAFASIRGLVSLSQRTLSVYAQAKSTAQKLDFNDLIRAAYQLLLKPGSSARRYYNENIAHILVDEFQDTNSVQSHLLALLAGPETRLFLIGDDKQSIYKFQGADVSTFNQWKEHFQGSGLAPEGRPAIQLEAACAVEHLEQSFRSHPSLVAFVNAVFESLFQVSESDQFQLYKARPQALEAARPQAGPAVRTEVVVFDPLGGESERQNGQESRALESGLVAAWIEDKVAEQAPVVEKSGLTRPIEFGDFAILVQRNDDFKALEKELARANIPYVSMGGSGFLEQQEVYDLENLLRFLACPGDGHALLAALRSPLFAVTDDLLHSLGQDGRSLWSAVQESARGEAGAPVLRQAVLKLRQLLQSARRARLPELVRTIIQKSNYDLVLMGAANAHQRVRNLWKLVSMAEERAHMSVLQFADLLESMRQLRVKQCPAPVDPGNSVKLITIHGAKGLEFPAVIVPVMGVDAGRLSGKLQFHRDYGIALDSTRDAGEEKPAFFRLAARLEANMALAEKKRLLYVAMTRARDYLGLFLDRRGRDVPSFRTWLSNCLELDLADGAPVSALKSLSASSGRARYWLRAVDQALISERQDKSRFQKADFTLPKVALDLLEPLETACEEPHRPWQELIRVTPGARSPAIEPTVRGKFFHCLMERLCLTLEPLGRPVIEQLARSEAIGVVEADMVEALVEEATSLLAKMYASSLFPLITGARMLFSEPSYLIVGPDWQEAWKRPDLLIQDDDRQWHVIDFKTDQFDPGQLEHQASLHGRQLQGYAQDIKALTGVRPGQAIYFAQPGILHWLSQPLP